MFSDSLGRLGLVDAGVGDDDDQVRATSAQGRHLLGRGVDHIAHPYLAGEVLAVPLQDLRRRDADDADLQRVVLAGLVAHRALEHHAGRERMTTAVGLHHVGVQVGKVAPAMAWRRNGRP